MPVGVVFFKFLVERLQVPSRGRNLKPSRLCDALCAAECDERVSNGLRKAQAGLPIPNAAICQADDRLFCR